LEIDLGQTFRAGRRERRVASRADIDFGPAHHLATQIGTTDKAARRWFILVVL
jgi:hypothetical protein